MSDSLDFSVETVSSPIPSLETAPVKFHGKATELFLLLLKNVFLKIVTLGIYSPWAKTEKRKYLWQNIEVLGYRLHYSGTGNELFFGYLKVFAVYIAYGILSVLANRLPKPAYAGFAVGSLLVFYAILPFIIYRSRQYLLSRTSLRGIRFGLDPNFIGYVKKFCAGYLKVLITLGIYIPFWSVELRREMLNNTFYGSRRFRYTGSGSDLLGWYLTALILAPLTLGGSLFWYSAKTSQYHAEHTHFDGAQFASHVTGLGLFGLYLTNVLVLIFSAGLAAPWVIVHNMNYFMNRMSMTGMIDFDTIAQTQSTGDAALNDAADFLGADFAL